MFKVIKITLSNKTNLQYINNRVRVIKNTPSNRARIIKNLLQHQHLLIKSQATSAPVIKLAFFFRAIFCVQLLQTVPPPPTTFPSWPASAIMYMLTRPSEIPLLYYYLEWVCTYFGILTLKLGRKMHKI